MALAIPTSQITVMGRLNQLRWIKPAKGTERKSILTPVNQQPAATAICMISLDRGVRLKRSSAKPIQKNKILPQRIAPTSNCLLGGMVVNAPNRQTTNRATIVPANIETPPTRTTGFL